MPLPLPLQNQRGNILFLILLAIVLFVALTYAVNSGMRGGGKDASSESASAQASAIIQYAGLMQNTINRLMLVNGCKENQISFENPVVTGYTNSNAPSDKRCHVFDPAGGGMSWLTPNTSWLDSSGANTSYANYGQILYTTRACVEGVGASNNCTTLDVELLMIIGFLSRDICFDLARKSDVLNSNGTIPIDSNESYVPTTKFAGNYQQTAAINNVNGLDSSRSLYTRYAGCFQADDDAAQVSPLSYHFYQVLLAR